MKKRMTYPYSVVNGKPIPDPESVIFLLLSRYRDSDYSDKELAKYISKGLASVLHFHDCQIRECHTAEGISFKAITPVSNRTSWLKKLVKFLR